MKKLNKKDILYQDFESIITKIDFKIYKEDWSIRNRKVKFYTYYYTHGKLGFSIPDNNFMIECISESQAVFTLRYDKNLEITNLKMIRNYTVCNSFNVLNNRFNDSDLDLYLKNNSTVFNSLKNKLSKYMINSMSPKTILEGNMSDYIEKFGYTNIEENIEFCEY